MTRLAFLFLAISLAVISLAGWSRSVGAVSIASFASSDSDAVTSVLAQTDTPGDDGVEAQAETGDGTKPLRILAVLLGVLALLLGALTRLYWKATIPEARRGYLPEASQAEYGGGHGPTT
ncbi:MAG: hypothetical protein GXP35_14400 [Actinobacteria bacterium]|nr:hypothetical protein [Actinomycetota bacterium]